MSIRDAQTTLWEAAALSGAGPTVSTNCYDTGAPYAATGINNDIASGEPMCAVIAIGVAADFVDTNETYLFQVVTATAVDLTTGQKIIATSKTYALADSALLAAGRRIILPLPPGSVDQRYIGLRYTGAGTTPSVTVTAWLCPMSMADEGGSREFYKSAIVVL